MSDLVKIAVYFAVDDDKIHAFLSHMQLDMSNNAHGLFIGWEPLSITKDEIATGKAISLARVEDPKVASRRSKVNDIIQQRTHLVGQRNQLQHEIRGLAGAAESVFKLALKSIGRCGNNELCDLRKLRIMLDQVKRYGRD